MSKRASPDTPVEETVLKKMTLVSISESDGSESESEEESYEEVEESYDESMSSERESDDDAPPSEEQLSLDRRIKTISDNISELIDEWREIPWESSEELTTFSDGTDQLLTDADGVGWDCEGTQEMLDGLKEIERSDEYKMIEEEMAAYEKQFLADEREEERDDDTHQPWLEDEERLDDTDRANDLKDTILRWMLRYQSLAYDARDIILSDTLHHHHPLFDSMEDHKAALEVIRRPLEKQIEYVRGLAGCMTETIDWSDVYQAHTADGAYVELDTELQCTDVPLEELITRIEEMAAAYEYVTTILYNRAPERSPLDQTKVIMEQCSSNTSLVIEREQFAIMCKEALSDYTYPSMSSFDGKAYTIEEDALEALQEAAEAYLIDLFDKAGHQTALEMRQVVRSLH